jgi:hypothetical protein
VIAFDRLGSESKKLCVGALLVAQDVAVGFAQKFVARLAVNAQAELVAHRAGRDVQGRFLAEHCGGLLFEAADRGIVAENVVSHFGGGHGGAHRGRGTRDRIAAKVDRQFHFGFSFALFVARMDDALDIIAIGCEGYQGGNVTCDWRSEPPATRQCLHILG